MTLAHLNHSDQVAAILTASEAAIRSAVGTLNSARRQTIGRKGGRKRSTAERCPVCAADTLATIASRGRCRGCGYRVEK
jgi:hypothetical protein